jgi:hypothetical protein
MKYCDREDQPPVPVRGGIIEIGGQINLTDEKGNYFLANVPKSALSYTVNLTSGNVISGKIIPPLIDDLNSIKIRNLWLCEANNHVNTITTRQSRKDCFKGV